MERDPSGSNVNVPFSCISRAARTNELSAARDKADPTLIRLTSLRAVLLDGEPDAETLAQISADWPELLAAQALGPDREHVFVDQLIQTGPLSHIRLEIFPDGGISRMRLFGRKAL